MEAMTLEQVSERFEKAAQATPRDIPALRAGVVTLLQRAGDVAVTADQEPAKRCVVESLRWSLDMIDSGQVRE